MKIGQQISKSPAFHRLVIEKDSETRTEQPDCNLIPQIFKVHVPFFTQPQVDKNARHEASCDLIFDIYRYFFPHLPSSQRLAIVGSALPRLGPNGLISILARCNGIHSPRSTALESMESMDKAFVCCPHAHMLRLDSEFV